MARLGVLVSLSLLACGLALVGGSGRAGASSAGPAIRPLISDFQQLNQALTPPSEAACNAIGRRCFVPAAMANSYDYASLLTAGNQGQGRTIAIFDAFGSPTIASDLNNFNTQFGLQHMCGEPGVTCSAGMPTFSILNLQGSPTKNPAPPTSNGTGLEDAFGWSVETSLDVEWAHATAPRANILLVETPTAEVLGVQGFQQLMNDEQYVIDHHLADVISQSFGAGEATFASGVAALQNLRQPFVDAQANHVTVLASTGDFGTANPLKEPVKNPDTIPYPSVGWPASDPLVTAVGGTYLCTDALTGTSVDSVSPPSTCQNNPGVREIGWIDSGGGYSILFPRPSFQSTFPPGSTYVGSSVGAPGPNSNMRGIPDIAYQASSRTGVLVYDTRPPVAGASGGWFIVGGTSSGTPQWAGLVAIADQMAGRDLGYINPGLYSVANNPAEYAADFHDVTVGCNQIVASIPGYCASTGWDAVTGLGTPDAAHLLPDLIAATP
jgi:subtilase family serine protease